MNEFLHSQIEYLLVLQNFRELTGGLLDGFFSTITMFGEIVVPMMIIALMYWCVNSKTGTFMLWNWSVGTIFCEILKSTFCIYRPWILDSRIHPVDSAFKMAGGYSFPSGHSQTAVSVWGGIAYCLKNKIFTLFMILLIILIGFSRNYLGVHTPQDVLAALFVAFVLLFATDKVLKWEEKKKNRDIVILIGAILLCGLLMWYEYTKVYPLDYADGALIVDPAHMRLYAFPKIGLMLGAFIGWFLDKRFLNFDGSNGTPAEKAVRFLVGIICMMCFSKYGTIVWGKFFGEQTSMFLATFLPAVFLTFIYPLIVTKITEKMKR